MTAERDCSLAEAAESFSKLSKKKSLALAGRIMLLRPQGGLIFFTFDDGTGRFQGLIKKDSADTGIFDLFSRVVDIGDFVEVHGKFFLTKRKEKTIEVKSWRLLSKSLRPLPEKWHGLQDVEERFRKRYLDLLMNEEVRTRFVLRSRMVKALRGLLDQEGFLEVDTSMLQPLAGGANALPFVTRHNALGIDLYLRVAPELDLKKLLVGGLPKIYEIGRSFRNEGVDATHNPEFTTVEWYEAYSSAERQRAFVERTVKAVVKEAVGDKKVVFDGNQIDFGKPFATVRYFELLQRYALITDPAKISRGEIALKAAQLGVKVEPADGVEKIMDGIYKKTCRPKLIQPAFIIDYPKNYIPLAKKKDGDDTLVDAFQLVAGGMEIAKAFSELNDPIDQRERFSTQEKNREAGDKEAQPNDELFLESLEYGCPPAGGVGIGLDRLTMLLTDAKNIKEVILFPTLRPKG